MTTTFPCRRPPCRREPGPEPADCRPCGPVQPLPVHAQAPRDGRKGATRAARTSEDEVCFPYPQITGDCFQTEDGINCGNLYEVTDGEAGFVASGDLLEDGELSGGSLTLMYGSEDDAYHCLNLYLISAVHDG